MIAEAACTVEGTHARRGEVGAEDLHIPSSHITLVQSTTIHRKHREKHFWLHAFRNKQTNKKEDKLKAQWRSAVFLSLLVVAQLGSLHFLVWHQMVSRACRAQNARSTAHRALHAEVMLHTFCFSQSAAEGV